MYKIGLLQGLGCLIVLHTILTINAQTVITGPDALVSSNDSVVEGSVIQIYCTIQNDTTVTFTWTHNGDPLLNDPPHIRIREDNRPPRSASLFTNDSTTVLTVDNFRASDNGIYQCTTSGATNGTAVTLTVDLNTTALIESPVVMLEGDNANISCRSVGAPVPSITWQFNNQTTGFQQTDTESPIESTFTSNRWFHITPGNIESSLHIVNASYPDHDGVYTCIGTNSDDLTVASSSASIIVQVNVIPMVEITATNTLVSLGDDVNISCSVLRGNPSNYNYTITNINTGSTATGPTLTLTDIEMTDIGTYCCDGTNIAGTGSAHLAIALEEHIESPIDVNTPKVGARWVVLHWTPSFDGNRLVRNFSLYIRSVDVSDQFTLISTLVAGDLMSSAGELMYNISMQGVIVPYTNYSFTVDACNDIGCSNQSNPSPVVRTNEDVSSAPTELTINSTQTTVSLAWTAPDMPNGVISHYDVSFVGTIDYDASFSEHTIYMELPTVEKTFTGRNEIVLPDLFPNTLFTVTVSAVNGAGSGMTKSITFKSQNAPAQKLLIQFRLLGIKRCQQWVAEDGRQKLNNLTEVFSTSIEERCQCGFSSSNVMNPSFCCLTESKDTVTYRAEVSGTASTSPSQIVNYTKDWLIGGRPATFNFVTNSINDSFQVVMSPFMNLVCVIQTNELDATQIGGIISAGIILLFIFMVAIIGFYYWTKQLKIVRKALNKKRRKSRKKAEPRRHNVTVHVEQDRSATRRARGGYITLEEFEHIDSEYDSIV